MSTPTYQQTHAALRASRGSARRYPCHWCGRAAHEFACLCNDSTVIVGVNTSGKPVTYSTDLDSFVAACRSCHRRYDAERARQRRATAGLALTPRRPKPKRQIARAPETPEPEALFALTDF